MGFVDGGGLLAGDTGDARVLLAVFFVLSLPTFLGLAFLGLARPRAQALPVPPDPDWWPDAGLVLYEREQEEDTFLGSGI